MKKLAAMHFLKNLIIILVIIGVCYIFFKLSTEHIANDQDINFNETEEVLENDSENENIELIEDDQDVIFNETEEVLENDSENENIELIEDDNVEVNHIIDILPETPKQDRNKDIGKISETRYAGILSKSTKEVFGNYNAYDLYVGNSTITINTVRDLTAHLGQNMTIDIEGSIENFILKNIYPTLNKAASDNNIKPHPSSTLAKTGPELSFAFITLLIAFFLFKSRKKEYLR